MLSVACFIPLGADIVLGHYALRVLLWQEGQLPLRLISWLETLHQRKLLQRVGGSYHLIHKRLQEYLTGSHCSDNAERKLPFAKTTNLIKERTQ